MRSTQLFVGFSVALLLVAVAQSSAGDLNIVRDIYRGPDRSLDSEASLCVVGSTVFFAATSISGVELWKSDGTAGGTVLVKDIAPGSASSFPNELVNVNGTLFFAASSEGSKLTRELWKSDGTEAGTVLVKDINPTTGSNIFYMTALGSKVFFAANDGTTDTEPWISDGTSAGTFLLRDIYSGGSSLGNGRPLVVGSNVFFVGNQNDSGLELWKSDGTSAGTVMVKDIGPGLLSGLGSKTFGKLGSNLIFTADDGLNGQEPWISDGTDAGTLMIANVAAGGFSSFPLSYTTVGSVVYFAADDGVVGIELWKTDGTSGGTVLVKDIDSRSPTASNGSQPMSPTLANSESVDLNGVLIFSAIDGNGEEVWRSDGTPGGTFMLLDISAGSTSSNPSDYIAVGNLVYFIARTDTTGYELYVTDGTTAGTTLVQDLNPGLNSSLGSALTPIMVNAGGLLFLRADEGTRGMEPWKVPPAPASAPVVADQSTTAPVNVFLDYGVIASQHPTLFAATGLPSSLTIDPDTGVIFGTPTAQGTFTVNLSATNSLGTGTGILTLTVGSGGGTTPGAPVISSATSASGALGQSFSYTITASNSPTTFDAIGLPAGLSIDSALGDIFGTPSESGTFNVTISATNSIGTGSATLTITIATSGGGVGSNSDIDTDGDGYADELEQLAGSSSTSASSTPLGANAGAPFPLSVTKIGVSLNFNPATFSKDSISLAGTLAVALGYEPLGDIVIVDVGGVYREFQLDGKGKGVAGLTDKFSVKIKRVDGIVLPNPLSKYSVKISKGEFAFRLQDEQLTDSNLDIGESVKNTLRTVPVTMVFNRANLRTNQTVLFSARQGKSGKAKQP